MEYVFLYLVLLIIYFLPSVLAVTNESDKTGPVIVVNLFLGWTLIGWVVAFAMAVSKNAPRGNHA